MTFQEWVKKWDIGPGMNDRVGTKNYSGFDGYVGEGWVNVILEPLAQDLVALGWDRKLDQVKEKFGTLRFYIGAGSEEIHDRIRQAEKQSCVTCEECGAPGETNGRGWLVTLCTACRKAYDTPRAG